MGGREEVDFYTILLIASNVSISTQDYKWLSLGCLMNQGFTDTPPIFVRNAE